MDKDSVMQKKKIFLSSPTMHGEERKFVEEAFDTNWVAPLGPNVNSFEKEMEEYTGCGYAAALSAGTAAIHLALRLIGIQPGDVVESADQAGWAAWGRRLPFGVGGGGRGRGAV